MTIILGDHETMLARLVRPFRERQASRGHAFVPRLEPLEDRLTPSPVPPLNPVISNQLSLSGSIVAQQQKTQTTSNQLTGPFLFFYTQAAHQNPTQTNDLMWAESVLVTDLQLFALDAQLSATDPALANGFTNLQNSILASPVFATPTGAAAATLAASLALNVLTTPSTQPLLTATQLSYMLAYQQNPSQLGALNELVVSEVFLSLAQAYSVLDPVLHINDPTIAPSVVNEQMAIEANPVYHTTFGSLTAQMVQAVTLSIYTVPS